MSGFLFLPRNLDRSLLVWAGPTTPILLSAVGAAHVSPVRRRPHPLKEWRDPMIYALTLVLHLLPAAALGLASRVPASTADPTALVSVVLTTLPALACVALLADRPALPDRPR
ncbi:MAG: hypothetical protein U0835_26750 [Isosphaeraceae bacterium]